MPMHTRFSRKWAKRGFGWICGAWRGVPAISHLPDGQTENGLMGLLWPGELGTFYPMESCHAPITMQASHVWAKVGEAGIGLRKEKVVEISLWKTIWWIKVLRENFSEYYFNESKKLHDKSDFVRDKKTMEETEYRLKIPEKIFMHKILSLL